VQKTVSPKRSQVPCCLNLSAAYCFNASMSRGFLTYSPYPASRDPALHAAARPAPAS
jgi:hypothetical protein